MGFEKMQQRREGGGGWVVGAYENSQTTDLIERKRVNSYFSNKIFLSSSSSHPVNTPVAAFVNRHITHTSYPFLVMTKTSCTSKCVYLQVSIPQLGLLNPCNISKSAFISFF